MNIGELANKTEYVCQQLPAVPEKIELRKNRMIYPFKEMIRKVIEILG